MGGRIIKTVNTSAVHLLLKRGGGLTFEGGVFSGEYGIHTLIVNNESLTVVKLSRSISNSYIEICHHLGNTLGKMILKVLLMH